MGSRTLIDYTPVTIYPACTSKCNATYPLFMETTCYCDVSLVPPRRPLDRFPPSVAEATLPSSDCDLTRPSWKQTSRQVLKSAKHERLAGSMDSPRSRSSLFRCGRRLRPPRIRSRSASRSATRLRLSPLSPRSARSRSRSYGLMRRERSRPSPLVPTRSARLRGSSRYPLRGATS